MPFPRPAQELNIDAPGDQSLWPKSLRYRHQIHCKRLLKRLNSWECLLHLNRPPVCASTGAAQRTIAVCALTSSASRFVAPKETKYCRLNAHVQHTLRTKVKPHRANAHSKIWELKLSRSCTALAPLSPQSILVLFGVTDVGKKKES